MGPHLYKSIRKPCAQSEYSDQHGHLLCALGLRCVFLTQRDAKTQGFLIHKKEKTLIRMGLCQLMANEFVFKKV